MAFPHIFISSTCYDLAQIRDGLSEFVLSYCYVPTLSERGDVFYHPDLHTHESCVNEIGNCQMFILIIGGRFGGNYKYDKTKSITNAEYESAKMRKIPVFTFIKRDVYEDHRVYEKNKKNKELIKEIIFPSIENQDYAVNIFEFINQVRQSEVNNGLLAFEYLKDIKTYLGKQWAGLMFEFLSERNKESNQKIVKNTLDNLTLINKKTEELIEGIVRKLNPDEGNQQIKDLDKIVEASKFFKHVLNMYHININDIAKQIVKISPKNKKWYEYLSEFEGFELNQDHGFELEHEELHRFKTKLSLHRESVSWSVLTEDGKYPSDVEIAEKLFENIKSLNTSELSRILEFM
jgi:hypothetical protein